MVSAAPAGSSRQSPETKGVDYAAHIGGLTTGFVMGLAATRPVIGERSYTRSDLRRLAQTIPVAVAMLAGGIWWARTAAATLVGDGPYWYTAHWLGAGEHSVNRRFNEQLALVKAGKENQRALAADVENDALPFWRQASARLSTITLPPDSPNLSALERVRELSASRVRALELFSKGLQSNKSQEIGAAEREMRRGEERAKSPRQAR